MRSYRIAELEQLTGIKAHTIRIWEKRYNLITPDRTSTNYRRYDDEQLKKLLNVSTLLSLGHKISHISLLNEKEMFRLVTESQEQGTDSIICDGFINNLLAAMLKYDEAAFEKTYSASVTRFGLFDAMINVFYPLLTKIGYLWTTNEVNPAQEHFASCLIKRKLMAATDGLPPAGKKSKKFLLSLLPTESHDISLLFANYIIRAKGHETVYLGQDVPFENIFSTLEETKPQFFLTFFTLSQNLNELSVNLKNKLSLPANVTFLIGGNSSITDHLEKKFKAGVLKGPKDLAKYLK
ncbi:MerR family transcriptional regulator [Sphingobacteriaceae bacterium]|nr:MerR family transcriptional regulator [Sphingobacteriaceae bacterium]